MRAIHLTIAILLATIGPVWATDSPSGPLVPQDSASAALRTQPLYKSIWRQDDDGTIFHLQSALACGARVGEFQRQNVSAYNATALDISCNYVDPRRSLITVYLTQRTTGTLADAFAEAEREMLQAYPDATNATAPVRASDGSSKSAFYSRSGGQIHEGIWIDDLSGWTLEFRATWSADDETSVLAEVGKLTSQVQQSAGVHLERCAKSSMPSRDGVAVGSDKSAMNVAFTASAMVEALPGGGKFTPDPATQPLEWCVETSITTADQTVLLWHGLNEMGTTVEADRATLVTTENPLVLESYADPEFNKIETELKRTDTPIYTVTHTNGDDVNVIDYFSHRPNGVTLARILSDVVNRKAHITARYNVKTKNITIATPESH